MTFQGFTAEGLAFLRELALNNDALWFKPRKDVYEAQVKAPMIALVADVLTGCVRAKLPFGGDPAKAMFRINRDVRFSKDKSPYKTSASAALTRTGVKGDPGVLYLHVEPSGSFTAAGFYQPPPELVEAWRWEMINKPKPWLALVRALDEAGLPLEEEDALKRIPRGFEMAKDSEVERFVRLKNFVVRRPLAAASLRSPKLVDEIVAFAETARPLLEFGWKLS